MLDSKHAILFTISVKSAHRDAFIGASTVEARDVISTATALCCVFN